VANDTVQNLDVPTTGMTARFEEIGALTGFAFDSYGNTRGAMGIDACPLHRATARLASPSAISPTR
jgi:hypothetical protein